MSQKFIFTFNRAPLSINDAYYRNRQRNKKCRIWCDEMHDELNSGKNLETLLRAKEAIASFKIPVFEVKLTTLFPPSQFFTAKGEVKIHTKDLTNVEKFTVDILFDKRYVGRLTKTEGTLIDTLEQNDKQIVKLESIKKPELRSEPQIIVEIEVFECSEYYL